MIKTATIKRWWHFLYPLLRGREFSTDKKYQTIKAEPKLRLYYSL